MFREASIAVGALFATAQLNSQISLQSNFCVFSLQGATYDLSPLMGLPFSIQDNQGNSDQLPWTYVVSVCGDMRSFHGGGLVNCTITCNDMAPGVPRQCSMADGPAFQVCTDPQMCGLICRRLADTFANQQVNVDPFNPSHGLTVQYTNGDVCVLPLSNGYVSIKPRSMSLAFTCADDGGLFPSQDMVNEDISCGYHAVIFSKLGCPLECQNNSGPLCSGHGICDYDTSQSVARCFCDTNWTGPFCFEQVNATTNNTTNTTTNNTTVIVPPQQQESYTGNIVGGFAGGIFAGITLVAIYGFILAKARGVSYFEGFYGISGGGGAFRTAHGVPSAGFEYPARGQGGPNASRNLAPPSLGKQEQLLA